MNCSSNYPPPQKKKITAQIQFCVLQKKLNFSFMFVIDLLHWNSLSKFYVASPIIVKPVSNLERFNLEQWDIAMM